MACPDICAITYARNTLNRQCPERGKGEEQVWEQPFLLFFYISLFPINQKVRNSLFLPRKDLRGVRKPDTKGKSLTQSWGGEKQGLMPLWSYAGLHTLTLLNGKEWHRLYKYSCFFFFFFKPDLSLNSPEQGSECRRSTHLLLLSVLTDLFLL